MTYLITTVISALCLALLFQKRRKKLNLASKIWSEIQKPEDETEPITRKDPPELAGKEGKEALDFSAINRAYRIADMNFSRGNLEEAEKWFIKVLALNDQHTEALNFLGVIYIHQNNLHKAKLIYRKLLSITQKEPAYYCNYGRCLYSLGRPDEALEAYENAIKLDSLKPSRFISAGQIYYEKGEFEKALSCFAKALDLDMQNADYLRLVSELAEIAGDSERLHRTLKKIAELDPYNEKAKEKLAQIEK